jgi:hypothetical protein
LWSIQIDKLFLLMRDCFSLFYVRYRSQSGSIYNSLPSSSSQKSSNFSNNSVNNNDKRIIQQRHGRFLNSSSTSRWNNGVFSPMTLQRLLLLMMLVLLILLLYVLRLERYDLGMFSVLAALSTYPSQTTFILNILPRQMQLSTWLKKHTRYINVILSLIYNNPWIDFYLSITFLSINTIKM